tara:strand:- start:3005 stop:4276 length:1272 start_codon:yes stop_codon:yes gene_type:complete
MGYVVERVIGMRRATTALFIYLTLSTLSITAEADWPEFRGGSYAGHALNSDVPLRWSERDNVRWKVGVPGKAWSTPAVAEGRVYVTTATTEQSALSLQARCYDLVTGEQIWEREAFKLENGRIHKKNSHASPSPIYDNGRLYVHFGHSGTACIDARTGGVLWKQTGLPYKPVHGNGGSPLLFEDKLIFSCDGAEDPFVAALDKVNGRILWKTSRDVEVSRSFSFSTPLPIEVNGRPQVIIPGSGAVIAYDPREGSEIWRFRYGEGYSVVPRPVYSGGMIYVCSGFNQANLFAIEVDGQGDVTDTHLVWSEQKTIPKESSPIIVGDQLYLNDDKGILTCFDAATGSVHYRERLDGKGGYSASPVFANGHLFFHSGDGVTTVIKPGKNFAKVAENKINEFGLSSLAVTSDGFIVRTENHLWRIGE